MRHLETWAGEGQPTVCSACKVAWPCETATLQANDLQASVARIAATPAKIGAVSMSSAACDEFKRRHLRRKNGGWVILGGNRVFVMVSSGGNLLRIMPQPP